MGCIFLKDGYQERLRRKYAGYGALGARKQEVLPLKDRPRPGGGYKFPAERTVNHNSLTY